MDWMPKYKWQHGVDSFIISPLSKHTHTSLYLSTPTHPQSLSVSLSFPISMEIIGVSILLWRKSWLQTFCWPSVYKDGGLRKHHFLGASHTYTLSWSSIFVRAFHLPIDCIHLVNVACPPHSYGTNLLWKSQISKTFHHSTDDRCRRHLSAMPNDVCASKHSHAQVWYVYRQSEDVSV